MKQLIQVFLTDVRMNLKHWMGAYMVIVPLAILLILKLFIPSVESTKATIAVVSEGVNAVESEMIVYLDDFAKIKEYPSIEEMENKLKGTGSVEGLYWNPDEEKYISVVEKAAKGKPVTSLASQVIRQKYYEDNYGETLGVMEFSSGVPDELSDRSETSPVASTGGSIFFVFMIIISGFIIGLGIVDDKENGTDRAILVSPVTKGEYFVGKSIYPLIIIAVYAIIGLLILGLMEVNILQVYTLVIVSFSTTLLFGLLLGALASNENEAIGVGKLLGWVVMLAILGGTMLPDNWQWAVWWAPFFWIFDMMEGVFTNNIEWIEIAWKSAITIGLTIVFTFLLRKKIIKGLS